MKCPDSELISRYVDGELNESEREDVRKHLQECEHCLKDYRSFSSMKQLMTEYWDGKTTDCFDSDTLAEYLEGLVDDDVKKQIEEHVAHCEVCASDLELMRQIEAAPEQKIVMPEETDKRILASILAKREEILTAQRSLPTLSSIKEDFRQAARKLTERFIGKYHESEQSLVESFWRMFAPSYNRNARFGDITFDPGVSGVAGDSRDIQTPTIIFTMMGICDYLQDYNEMPDEKQFRSVIRQNTKRFDVSRNERQKLEEFLFREFIKD